MIEQDEMKGGVKVCELVEHLGLAVVNKGADFETALVGIRDVNRPGLQLVGFFDYFDPRRLQVIGMAETKMRISIFFCFLFSLSSPLLSLRKRKIAAAATTADSNPLMICS